jgi:thioredoxin 1
MVKQLNEEIFKSNIFDFEKNESWIFKGDKPSVIDFYADWCQPCKKLGPIIDEVSEEYSDIDFYKVDTQNEEVLSQLFGIRSIPSILFIPIEGQPSMIQGLISKDMFKEHFKELFNK